MRLAADAAGYALRAEARIAERSLPGSPGRCSRGRHRGMKSVHPLVAAEHPSD